MSSASEPIGPGELDGLFARFFVGQGEERAALAVSGGSDSTALMVLFAAWLAQTARPPSAVTVLTVDHGLRPESAAEARSVAQQAAALGLRHAILPWHGAKPEGGLQAAARQARYRLMAQYMREHAILRLVTAHTADDQAETLLMRLARGSGLDGLCAMAPVTLFGDDPREAAIEIVRPLLEVSKTRLRAALDERGVPWVEDPSNQSPAFERVRLRAAREQLGALGLTSDMLVLSAHRLQRARAAIEAAVTAFDASGALHIDPCGFFRIDRHALRAAPEEIAVRVLTRVIAAAGGWAAPVPLANVEAIAAACRSDGAGGSWTLARALVTVSPEIILVEREPGRERLPRLAVEPQAALLWDGRFLITAGAGVTGALEVAAVGEEGARGLRRAGALPQGLPPRALQALPAFWKGTELIAVPCLDFWCADAWRDQLSTRFIGLDRYNSQPPRPAGSSASEMP